MPSLTTQDLDQLLHGHRKQQFWVLFAGLPAAAAATIALATTGLLTAQSGAFIGLLLGGLLLLPERRIFKKYGLSRTEGRLLIRMERGRRSGFSARPAEWHLARELLRARILLGLGVVSGVLLVASASYVFQHAGDPTVEGDPSDSQFATAFFTMSGAFVGTFTFLFYARMWYSLASDSRQTIAADQPEKDTPGGRHRTLADYQQALPALREAGDRAGEAAALNNIGHLYAGSGDQAQALAYSEKALSIRQEIGDRAGEAVSRYNIAMIHRAGGDLVSAVAELERVVELDRQVEHPDLGADTAMLDQVRRELAQGRTET